MWDEIYVCLNTGLGMAKYIVPTTALVASAV